MTIQGAISELINLLNADDIPFYYKGGIKKVIKTIDDYIDGKDDYIKRKTEPQTERVETMSCQECKHYEVGKPCKPFLNECDCHYEPQTENE